MLITLPGDISKITRLSNQVAGTACALQYASKRTESFLSLSEALIETVGESSIHADDTRSAEGRLSIAADLRDYISTHNRKYSKPQGANLVWNQANCRNRRFFNGRTETAAIKSERKFLLQIYRRDMGKRTSR